MPKRQKLVDSMTLLGALPPLVVEEYCAKGIFRFVEHPKNGMIHLEGEPCRKLDVILSGRVSVVRIDESGDVLIVSTFASNDILGANLLFSSSPHYPLTVMAQEPTLLLQIDGHILFSLFLAYPDFLRCFLEYMSDHTVALSSRIRHYVNRTIRESILNYLRLERVRQGKTAVRLSVTKKELAEMIGVQRTSLSRELAKMQADGILVCKGRIIEMKQAL